MAILIHQRIRIQNSFCLTPSTDVQLWWLQPKTINLLRASCEPRIFQTLHIHEVCYTRS